jgi:hypothetical protein
MARICNDEQASSGVMSGHDRKTLSLSVLNEHQVRTQGASALALVFSGLLSGFWVWRLCQRDAIAHRVSALQMNHFHAVMSQTNRLILRRPDPSELFKGVCEVCVKAGHQ